jgi:heme exporter protein A
VTELPAVLHANALSLSRGERSLFADLSFTVRAGEALILRGPNGVGKTSLLRVLAGLTVADKGQLTWQTTTLKPLSATQRAIARYVGHANQLKDELTAEENLADQLALDGIDCSHESRLEALNQVGLLQRRHVPARKLSQGQKRRIGIAALLRCDKALWLLDEPTNALDSEGVTLLLEAVDARLARGGLAVIASHLPMPLRAVTHELQMQEQSMPMQVMTEGHVA